MNERVRVGFKIRIGVVYGLSCAATVWAILTILPKLSNWIQGDFRKSRHCDHDTAWSSARLRHILPSLSSFTTILPVRKNVCIEPQNTP